MNKEYNKDELVELLENDKETKCYEICPSEKGYKIKICEFPSKMTRLHVDFETKQFSLSSFCKWKYFIDDKTEMVRVKGYQLFTPDFKGNKNLKSYSSVFLVKKQYVKEIVEKAENNEKEVNICPCMIEWSRQGHGGTIILGTESKLTELVNEKNKLKNKYTDSYDELMVFPLNDLLNSLKTNKIYTNSDDNKQYNIKYVIGDVLKHIKTTNEIMKKDNLYMIVGIINENDGSKSLGVSNGKRKPFETPKECAIRELYEEYNINDIHIDKFNLAFYTCMTEFYYIILT